jgi:electron transfer flavoprotein alpha subunit
MEALLCLVHAETDGSLARPGREVVGATRDLAASLGEGFDVGVLAAGATGAAHALSGCGARRVLVADAPELAPARYATDAAAAFALAQESGATIVLAPHTPRFARVLPGVAFRLGGRADTHVTGVGAADGSPSLTRWYYRQRMEAVLTRGERPWVVLLEPGCGSAWAGPAGDLTVETVSLTLPPPRTTVEGFRAPAAGEQTIRPEADLLFVAGAGWTKPQADGAVRAQEGEKLILDFLRLTRASLGGSKSLVDLAGEGQAVLRFMTHLNQVGQTGSTPRHPRGLATCCHGEEPHTVGWRFIGERRAINRDPGCGWTRGKADVVYVADAFAVMARVNALLEEKLAASSP